MIIRIFYRAMRMISWIILIMAAIFVISKILPVIGGIVSFIVKTAEVFLQKLDKIKNIIK